jgi:hypothetical protein
MINIADVVSNISLLDVLKVIIMAGEFFYILFAFVLSRQVRLMVRSFSSPLDIMITTTSRAHFFAAVLLAALSLILL